MEVHCGSCPAKYAVPDDKVRGRKVRIKCKHCSAPIVVDGTRIGQSTAPRTASAKPAATQPSVRTAAQSPKPATTAAAVAPRPRTTSGSASAAAAGPLHVQARAPQPAPQPPAEQRPDAAVDAGWHEPAREPSPRSEPHPHAGWREPAARGSQGIKSTMLGIPAPATMPARSNKATLLGLDAPVAAAPPPAVESRGAGVAPAPLAGATRSSRSVKRTMLGIPAPAGELPLRPEAPKPAPEPPAIEVRAPEPPAVQPEFDKSAEPEWTVAVTDEDHQDMTTAQVIEAFAAGTITDATFIWAEGMDDWKMPFDIPLIAAELGAHGFAPGTASASEDDRTVIAEPPRESKPSGVWREPGSWRDGEGESDISFDDVTVSMDSHRAAELLREAGAMDEAPRQGSALDALLDDAAHEDVTLAVDSRPFFAESRPLSDSLSGAERDDDRPIDWDDEQTTAMESAAAAASEGKPTGARNEDSVLFSLDALAKSESAPKTRAAEPAADEILIPSAPPPSAPVPGFQAAAPPPPPAFAQTLPASGFPAAERPAAPVPPMPPAAFTDSPAQALAPPPSHGPAVQHAVPGPMPSTHPKRSSLAWLWVLLLLLLVAAAASVAFVFRQPAKLFELLGLP